MIGGHDETMTLLDQMKCSGAVPSIATGLYLHEPDTPDYLATDYLGS